MSDQFTTEWAVEKKQYSDQKWGDGQDVRRIVRKGAGEPLYTEEQALDYCVRHNGVYGEDQARVVSRRVTEWMPSNPKPEETEEDE